MNPKFVVACVFPVFLILIVACGNEDAAASFIPYPVPQGYQALTLESLKVESNSYDYVNLRDNIERHKGELLWYVGDVERVYSGSVEGTYQIWLCTAGLIQGGKLCYDPILLLHSLDRGPEFFQGDKVEIAGVLIGTATYRRNIENIYPAPIVSVIKAEHLAE